MALRRISRLLAMSLVLAVAGMAGGCATPAWDPADLLDFLDTKKRAPGERKPVFPEGVPGIAQGVPRDLVRGSPEHRAAADAQAATASPQVSEPPPPPQAPARRARTAAKRPAAQQQPVEIAPDEVNVEDEAPPPPPRRQAQRPTRAQPLEPQQQANPFPTPLPR